MSKMKKTILGLIAGVATMATGAFANADQILFPYINSNTGNVSTLITVINAKEASSSSKALHYRYFTKLFTASHDTCCEERDFCRPTTNKDIVTFDVAYYLESGAAGKAMFNDATSYSSGAGAPRFDLPNMGFPEGRRGYLLVSHADGPSSCIDMDPSSSNGLLDGEAMVVDIVNGAAWSYRAVLPAASYNGTSHYYDSQGKNFIFGTDNRSADADTITGNLPAYNPLKQFDALRENDGQPVALYPPSIFETRFFVTPLRNDLDSNMKGRNIVKVQLTDWDFTYHKAGITGVYDRNENFVSGGKAIQVCCVASICLSDFAGSSNLWGSWFSTQGGWSFVSLTNPSVSSAEEDYTSFYYDAIVFKLQYTTGPSIVGSSVINSADLIKSYRGGFCNFERINTSGCCGN
jgi:hypothetical protein